MRSKLEGSKIFEILNNEKITPTFINLCKGSKSEASLSDLKNENGLDFRSEEDTKEYVRDFYKKLYKSPECDSVFSDTCIEDFLGEEILNSRDGLSNCFIKKYWEFLRVPLHRYTTCCQAKT
jgi:hypothetical protein